MLGNIQASAAVRKVRALWAHAGISLVAAGALMAPCCDGLSVETDCIKASASDLSCTGGVTAGHLDIQVKDDEGCPDIESATLVSYNNRDGKPGFDPEGGDLYVSSLTAQSAPPTGSLSMGQFSSASDDGSVNATSWQLDVGNADGTQSTFSGKF